VRAAGVTYFNSRGLTRQRTNGSREQPKRPLERPRTRALLNPFRLSDSPLSSPLEQGRCNALLTFGPPDPPLLPRRARRSFRPSSRRGSRRAGGECAASATSSLRPTHDRKPTQRDHEDDHGDEAQDHQTERSHFPASPSAASRCRYYITLCPNG